MFKNYIFDLYGTLVDINTNERKYSVWDRTAWMYSLQGAHYSARELKKSYLRLAEREEAALADKLHCGREDVEIELAAVFDALYREKGIAPTGELVRDTGVFFRALTMEHICLYPGAMELLDRLKQDGKRIYLLSNAQRIFTVPELSMLGLYEKFDGILLSSDAGVRKPSGLFYQMLLDRYGLDKKESVMTGNDWQTDIWGAHAAGMAGMYVETAQSPERTGPLPEKCRILEEIGEAYVHDHKRA